MTQPTRSLWAMCAFLVIVTFGGAIIAPSLAGAFASNPWFNGLILGVLVIGVVINLRQVISLYREIDWVDNWRDGLDDEATTQPRLLSSMALMLSGRGDMSLSATSLRTLLDSIRSRLEESRDLSRYFIGLLIFLGLLGTFWGLMATVGSVTTVIRGMAVEGSDAAAVFETLKLNLEAPLAGMGIAFSSSLFGLAGSLVLGFLDLQAGHAQNRFVNELEEWLSGSTRLSSGLGAEDSGFGGAPAYLEALLEKTADALDRLQRSVGAEDQHRDRLREGVAELNTAMSSFQRLMREQNKHLEQLAATQGELGAVLRRLADADPARGLDEELRAELRLLSKTVANALKARDP